MHYSNVVEINFVESPGFKKIIEDGYSPVEIIRNITRISPETVFVPGETGRQRTVLNPESAG